MSIELEDEDDWVELERAPVGVPRPDVSISVRATKKSHVARLILSGDPGKLLFEQGHRMRIAIGGNAADRVRVVCDMERGNYEMHPFNKGEGIYSLNLGKVTAWPAEPRERVACEWKKDLVTGGIIITLPHGFAKSQKEPQPVSAPAAFKAAPAARVIDRRPTAPVNLGDPAPGRSALDQRKAVK